MRINQAARTRSEKLTLICGCEMEMIHRASRMRGTDRKESVAIYVNRTFGFAAIASLGPLP